MRNPYLQIAAALTILSCGVAVVRAQQQDWAKRDAWQRPEEVLDALQVKAGSVVADVGAGSGYFTFHLAERVGPQGKVYAEDIRADVLKEVRERAERERLKQIETVQGSASDPKLPEGALDAVLVVNAYHEFLQYDAMMQGMVKALKGGGLLAIIDAEAKVGEERGAYQKRHVLPKEIVREDAQRDGLHFVRELPGFKPPGEERTYYFLLFEKTEKK